MKVYAYPADEYGCGHYRVRWPAEACKANGMDVEVISIKGDTQISATLNHDGSIREVSIPDDADLLILQRPTHKFLSQAVPKIRARGVAVVVDMDDDLRTIHPANPAFMALHPKNRSIHSWQYASDACRNATLVTVSTPALLRRYAPHGRGRVITNKVPERFLSVSHQDSEVIGWGGSVHSHPNDLQTVGSSIANVVRRGAEFIVVGTGDDVARVLMLSDNPESTGVVEFEDWPQAITQIGIGIAPLADTVFNEAKSWLKPLEYSSVGVPWVASARSEYAKLAKMGGGIAVRKPREWEGALKKLINEPSMRQEMSEAGREVARTLTIEGCVDEWRDAWTWAVQAERDQTLVGVQ